MNKGSRYQQTRVSKAVQLLSLLPKRPVEFYDRLMTVVGAPRELRRPRVPNGDTLIFTDALKVTLGISEADIVKLLAESALLRLETNVAAGMMKMNSLGPFSSGHNGNFCLARSIYVICRVLSPETVLETGVAYGVTSAFALQALAVNRKGNLISIDLPPLAREAERYVGALIPHELRERWHLHRGPAKRILPGLIASIKEADVFVHDSLHTYRHMTFEFETAWPYVRPEGAIVADNVDLNDAFRDFTARVHPTFAAVVREENTTDLFGIMRKSK